MSAPSSIVKRVVVYLRHGGAPINTDAISTQIKEQAPGCDVTIHTSETGSFLPIWEAAKGDFKSAIADKSDANETFTCLVVEKDAGAAVEADIAYALYTKRIPVLDLRLSSNTSSAYVIGGTGCETKPHPMYTPENGRTSFYSFPTIEKGFGHIVVVEGGDGAGKQTQVALLCERLRKEGRRAETLDFPHDAADYGVLIRELLSGKMGNIKEVNPMLFASLYGLNRHATLPLLRYWRQRGAIVVLDRYFTANFGHQASKYTDETDRINAIKTLSTFELKWLGLPAPSKVIYLNLPPEFALQAMKGDVTREELDMHELAGLDYKNNVRSSFLWCCTALENWVEVPCVEGGSDGLSEEGSIADAQKRFSRQHVHDAVYNLVAPVLV